MKFERRRKSKKERILSLIVLFLAIRLFCGSWTLALIGVTIIVIMLVALGNRGLPVTHTNLADKGEQAKP
jgi:membrane protein implicated in regulation of membrane protease activity